MAETVLADRASASPSPPDPQNRHDPARTALATGVSVLATIVGLILLAWLVLFITKGRFLKSTFESYASRSAARQVRVAGDFQFYFHPIDIKFLAEGLTVSNPAWASRPNFFEAKLIDTRIETIPLIFGKRRAEWLELAGAKIDAEWDAQSKRNTWTFGDPNAKGEPFELPVIRRATVSGTEVRYRDPKMQLFTDIKVETIKAADTRFASDVQFSGTGTLRAKPFTMTGSLKSPNQTVVGGRTQFTLHALASDTVMDVAGTLPGATVLEGSDLRVSARGANLARLFDLIGVAIPDTRRYRISSNLTKAGGEWRFTGMVGRFGDSDLAGRMTISFPKERLFVDADLASKSVDILDVGPFMGYNPNRLDAMGGKGAITQVNGTPRVLPDAPLRTESLAIFDAHVDYRVRRIRADLLPISDVTLTLDLNRGLLKLSPLTMLLSGGRFTSDIVIDSRQRPVFTDYDIRLATTPMGTLLKGFGVEESGTTGAMRARIKMTGRGDTVHDSLATSNGRIAIVLPKGTFWTRNIELSEFDIGTFVQKMFQDKLKKPVEINCGLIGFTVRNGIAAADPILIDTEKNVMTGKGGFSFKDESLDIMFRADAKKFSLFSGQSPVGINGHFAAPGLQIITPQLLARGGAGLALGLAASPLAAVLAFVDVGDAKDAACGPVLSGARASQQRTDKGQPRKDVGTGKPPKQGEKKEKKFLGIL